MPERTMSEKYSPFFTFFNAGDGGRVALVTLSITMISELKDGSLNVFFGDRKAAVGHIHATGPWEIAVEEWHANLSELAKSGLTPSLGAMLDAKWRDEAAATAEATAKAVVPGLVTLELGTLAKEAEEPPKPAKPPKGAKPKSAK